MPYFGIYIQAKNTGSSDVGNGGTDAEQILVFNQKSEALEVLKLHKEARLREFINREDAVKYALTGYEVTLPLKYPDSKFSTTIGLEKAAFRAPTKQELVEFRKLIERDEIENVKKVIWENPRYLVSSGDTPTTLKEGYRYNAMHICAISKRPQIAEIILQTVADPKFVDLLTGKKNDIQMCKELAANLLDYYLNIPEKGRSETPLHLSVKNGGIGMVEVLTSYPECKMTLNSDGALPKDIICSRVYNTDPEVYNKIEMLLKERFYVPVLRSEDSAIPPHIGQPFSSNSPPILNEDPLSPEFKIQALAGPMDKEQAKEFCRRWKTPPRIGSNASTSFTMSPFLTPSKQRFKNSTPLHTYDFPNNFDNNQLRRRSLFTSPKSISFGSEDRMLSTPTRTPTTTPITTPTQTPLKNIDKQNGNHKTNATANDFDFISSTSNDSYKNGKVEDNLTKNMIYMNLKNNYNNNNYDNDINNINNNYGDTGGAGDAGLNKTVDNSDVNVLGNSAITYVGISDGLHINQNESKVSQTTKDAENFDNLKNMLVWDTPLLKRKKDIFFHYRTKSVDSPLLLDSTPLSSTKCQSGSSLSCTNNRYDAILESPGFKERNIKITDPEKGLEVIGRELAKIKNIAWSEFWDFLNTFINISSNEGLMKFENYLARLINKTNENLTKNCDKTHVILDDVCNALQTLNVKNRDNLNHSNNYYNRGRRNSINDDRPLNLLQNNVNATTAQNEAIYSVNMVTQPTNPYTCVERSLQVFAKRMTKTIIHNINNFVSINDTLLSELKRLKSLICSFKEDNRFMDVDFTKVHARISNLISIYIANSQDVSYIAKYKIKLIIEHIANVPNTSLNHRREHIECVCKNINIITSDMLTPQTLPENLKSEEMCKQMWLNENSCNCHWNANTNRKISRRLRLETRYKNYQQEKNRKRNEKNGFDYRCTTSTNNDSSDDEEEEVFWSDFNGSSSDDEDVFFTPPESPAIPVNGGLGHTENHRFIFGNKPTKRDLDVLNAIYHIDIDSTKYPNIYNWKMAIMKYSCEEMDRFPSPFATKKSQSLSNITKNNGIYFNKLQSPKIVFDEASQSSTPTNTWQFKGSSMFEKTNEKQNAATTKIETEAETETLSKTQATSMTTTATSTDESQISTAGVVSLQQKVFLTPLNKMKGLFSKYRITNDETPLTKANINVASPLSSNNESTNLSLLNISNHD